MLTKAWHRCRTSYAPCQLRVSTCLLALETFTWYLSHSHGNVGAGTALQYLLSLCCIHYTITVYRASINCNAAPAPDEKHLAEKTNSEFINLTDSFTQPL